jgi:hypothetical protein
MFPSIVAKVNTILQEWRQQDEVYQASINTHLLLEIYNSALFGLETYFSIASSFRVLDIFST